MTNYNLKTYYFATLFLKVRDLDLTIRKTQECREQIMAKYENFNEWKASKYFTKYKRKLDRLFGYVEFLQNLADAGQFKYLNKNDRNQLIGALMLVAAHKYSY